jgi:hypothetical protein
VDSTLDSLALAVTTLIMLPVLLLAAAFLLVLSKKLPLRVCVCTLPAHARRSFQV